MVLMTISKVVLTYDKFDIYFKSVLYFIYVFIYLFIIKFSLSTYMDSLVHCISGLTFIKEL